MAERTTRCGFVALVGRPNVGKSTLINTLVGAKISIVTPKPQTTRHRILGVRHVDDCQMLFVDTPGLRDGHHNAMGQTMNRNADTSMADADVVVFVTEIGGLRRGDRHVLARLARHGNAAIAVLNKVDTVKAKSALLPELQALADAHDFLAVVPLSARTGDNVDALLRILADALPEGPWLYPADQLSDRPLAFRMAETIREKLMMALSDEVPYGIAVEIERLADTDERLEVDATIWVEKDSQKPIVIGKNGERLKQVGRAARIDLKRAQGRPVHLTLWVKVKKNWADSERALAALGYETGA